MSRDGPCPSRLLPCLPFSRSSMHVDSAPGRLGSARVVPERTLWEAGQRMADGASADAVQGVDLVRCDGTRAAVDRDLVAREEPLEIQLHGATLAVVMRTPGHDAELARGFLVTERVVARAAD